MPDRPPEPITYFYRASAMGAQRMFSLDDDGIAWEDGRRSGRIPYDSVTRVRMTYRPGNMQSQRFVTEIWSSTTPKRSITSTSTKGLFDFASQGREYREFLVALHRRLIANGKQITFVGGLPQPMFWFGVLLFVVAGLCLAGLAVRALQAGVWAAAALVAAFLFLFLWQGGTFLRRNRPVRYAPDGIPEELLPDV